METKPLIPTEQLEINLLKAPVLFRRMREHGTRSEQYLLQIPRDLLDESTDTRTNKRFKLRLGFAENKRVVVVFLDEFIFPENKQKKGSDLFGK